MATSLKLDDGLKDRVKAIAAQRDRSPHWIMVQAIEQYVIREEARASFLREGQQSLEHYLETGLHVTGEELHAWLDTWGTENEAQAPECHK
jgi:predicted transcriptional regulator